MTDRAKKEKKSLEEIMAEISLSSEEPEVPLYDEFAVRKVTAMVEQIAEEGRRLIEVCSAELKVLEEMPYLIHGSYPRKDFIEKVTAPLLEIEENLYFHSNLTVYDEFEIARYLHTNRTRDTEPVEIYQGEDCVLIRMPYLPAKYKSVRNLCNQLLAAKIYHTPSLPTWSMWQANYYHIFPTSTSTIPKDVDNYDYKRTNDILSYAFGTSDNALRFSMSMTTIFTDEIDPGSYIEITPKSLNFERAYTDRIKQLLNKE